MMERKLGFVDFWSLLVLAVSQNEDRRLRAWKSLAVRHPKRVLMALDGWEPIEAGDPNVVRGFAVEEPLRLETLKGSKAEAVNSTGSLTPSGLDYAGAPRRPWSIQSAGAFYIETSPPHEEKRE